MCGGGTQCVGTDSKYECLLTLIQWLRIVFACTVYRLTRSFEMLLLLLHSEHRIVEHSTSYSPPTPHPMLNPNPCPCTLLMGEVEENVQTSSNWQKGYSNSNYHSLQPRWPEKNTHPEHTHKMWNLEVDGLWQQKTTSGFGPISQKQESETTVFTGSLKSDSSRLEKCCLVSLSGW